MSPELEQLLRDMRKRISALEVRVAAIEASSRVAQFNVVSADDPARIAKLTLEKMVPVKPRKKK